MDTSFSFVYLVVTLHPGGIDVVTAIYPWLCCQGHSSSFNRNKMWISVLLQITRSPCCSLVIVRGGEAAHQVELLLHQLPGVHLAHCRLKSGNMLAHLGEFDLGHAAAERLHQGVVQEDVLLLSLDKVVPL